MSLRPYWITLTGAKPLGAGLGVGVTAQSEADAKIIFERAFGTEYVIAGIAPVEDLRNIEQNHVMPNMGNALQHGIWFPRI